VIIAEGVEQYRRQVRAQSAVATVKAYRRQAEQWRDLELQKALRALEAGADAELLLQQLARNLTNKIIHTPTTVLKNASANGRADVVRLAQELFDLTPDDIEKSES